MHDVIIVGGSYAGIAAALQLARARRDVLVLDAGERRNRFAHASHGFLGQDGEDPATIAARGREEVRAYPTVTWLDTQVHEARSVLGGFFVVRTGSGDHHAKRLILATGVADELPPIPGLAEQWGRHAFTCPYCDGYELNLGRVGVLITGPTSIHHAELVAEWGAPGKTVAFLNGQPEPHAGERAALQRRRIALERNPVASVAHSPEGIEVRLRNGDQLKLAALFLATRTRLVTPFAEQLGCALEEGPMGPFYKTSMMKETSVPGVFACGDAALPMANVSFAVADGVRAGVTAHASLVFTADAGHGGSEE